VIQKKNRRLVVVGWLRSSKYKEVPIHSGMLKDERDERVSVQLPCRSIKRAKRFNSNGRRLNWTPEFRQGWLEKIALRGDTVFVAELSCEPK
jgi:hypothetical protein